MTISAVSAAIAAPVQQIQAQPQAAAPVQAKAGSDGDSPAVEAAESSATKIAEKQNGGFAKAVNKLV